MNRIIKNTINDLVAPHGFAYKENSFVRIENDVLQGFVIGERKRQRGEYTNMELFFRILPLCYSEYEFFAPNRKFDSSHLECYRIGQLQPAMSLWPYIFKRGDNTGIQACADMICRDVKQFLLPFFFSCDDCCSIYKNYPEYEWFSDFSREWMYYTLKSNHLDMAINLLRRDIQQREETREINLQTIPGYEKSPAFFNGLEWDRRDREQIEFLTNATNEELQRYLQEKEDSSIRVIQSLLC